MTPIRKRRWLLALVAVWLVATVAGVVLLRDHAEHGLPRVVILKKKHLGRERYTYSQLDAPKNRGVSVFGVYTVNPSSGEERRTMPPRKDIVPLGRMPINVLAQLEVPAGQSKEMNVIPPDDNVWRLRCYVYLEKRDIETVLTRVRLCWRSKSLAFLRWKDWCKPGMIVESEPITNTVPRAPENPQLCPQSGNAEVSESTDAWWQSLP